MPAFERIYCPFSLAHHIGIRHGSNIYGTDLILVCDGMTHFLCGVDQLLECEGGSGCVCNLPEEPEIMSPRTQRSADSVQFVRGHAGKKLCLKSRNFGNSEFCKPMPGLRAESALQNTLYFSPSPTNGCLNQNPIPFLLFRPQLLWVLIQLHHGK